MLEPHEIAALVSVAKDAKFDDPRNRERLARIIEAAAADPSFSFPKMFADNSADLEGTYRFLANPVVTPDAILSSHFEATCEASANESTVLVVHDTSTFSFNPDGNRQGLGRVRSTGRLFSATSLSFSPMTGLGGLTVWLRSRRGYGVKRPRMARRTDGSRMLSARPRTSAARFICCMSWIERRTPTNSSRGCSRGTIAS